MAFDLIVLDVMMPGEDGLSLLSGIRPLIKTPVIDSVVGLGSGSLRAHYDAIVAGGGRFVVSGLSAKIRGVVDEDYVGKPAEVGMPNTLVDLIFSHDRTVVY